MDMLSNKNFEDSTQSEVEALKDEIEKAGGTEAYLDQRFGDGEDGIISDKTAQKYGYESAEAMIAAFTQGISDYDISILNIYIYIIRIFLLIICNQDLIFCNCMSYFK